MAKSRIKKTDTIIHTDGCRRLVRRKRVRVVLKKKRFSATSERGEKHLLVAFFNPEKISDSILGMNL